VKIVVDHIKGSRRGQRQEFAGTERVSIGRHPKSDVPFDAHRDLDASSRHAELRIDGEKVVICDVGSSNGTFLAGERMSEIPLEVGEPAVVQFGLGGPELRIWVGTDDMTPAPFKAGGRALRVWLAAGAIGVALAAAVIWWAAR